jgi:hypothetical protein
MTPSGSSFVVQDKRTGNFWLVPPDGAGEITKISREKLEALPFRNVPGTVWESWIGIAHRVDVLCDPPTEIEHIETTLTDVRRFLLTLSDDATDLSLVSGVLDEIESYLAIPAVIEDPTVADELKRIRTVANGTLSQTH